MIFDFTLIALFSAICFVLLLRNRAISQAARDKHFEDIMKALDEKARREGTFQRGFNKED